MELQVPIKIFDELSDEVIESTGQLDLASGEIRRVEYEDYDAALQGLPADLEDYEFTCGTLSNNGKDVEFRIEVNTVTGQYSVSASELLEIKENYGDGRRTDGRGEGRQDSRGEERGARGGRGRPTSSRSSARDSDRRPARSTRR